MTERIAYNEYSHASLFVATYPAAFGQFQQVLTQHALSSSTTAAQKEGSVF